MLSFGKKREGVAKKEMRDASLKTRPSLFEFLSCASLGAGVLLDPDLLWEQWPVLALVYRGLIGNRIRSLLNPTACSRGVIVGER